MSAKILVALVLCGCFAVIQSAPQWNLDLEGKDNLKIERNGQILQLKFLGTADGRSFFYEREQSMNWTDAKTLCESFDLEFASIETQAQADFLHQKIIDVGAQSYEFWLSARSGTHRTYVDFTYLDTNSTVDFNLFTLWEGIPLDVPKYCLTLYTYAEVFKTNHRDCSSLRSILCYHK